MIEEYQLPEGKIFIGLSNEQFSNGLLLLQSGKALQKHNRAVIEELVQVSGVSVIRLFDGDIEKERIVLNQGESLRIPANQFHIHSNELSRESITFWSFEGDITKTINLIKKNYKKIL